MNEENARTDESRAAPRLLLAATAAALVAMLAMWLLDIRGGGLPPWLARLAVVAAGATLLTLACRLAWRASVGVNRQSDRLLLGLIVLALAVRFVGIDHEIEERYYRDEGTYYSNAIKINEGQVFRPRFVYPHLTYYLYAVAIWAGSLFPAPLEALAGGVFGVDEPIAVQWLLMRSTVALLSVFTVIPVFRLGQLVQGRFVAATGALLFVLSPLFNEGSHLMISDAPSAIFATFSLWLAYRLVARESLRDYLLAGLFAGLAAAAKYPAGTVAIAIVAVWMGWRLRRRDWSWSLLWSGLAALATFVAVMPSLFVFPQQAFFGGQGIFFGVRQYGGGGWIGVMPASNTAYYARQLALSFGLPLLLMAPVGLAVLGRGLLRRWLWLLPFPAAYLLLIGSMNMVVKRNLFPAVPALAVLLAAGLYGLWRAAAPLPRGRLVQAALLAAALALPVWATALQTLALARPGTRVVAREWIRQHLPRGAFLIKDTYTPRLHPGEYRARQARFVARLGLDALRRERVDAVLVSSSAYARFFDAERFKPHHEQFRQTYQRLFAEHELLYEIAPSQTRTGPRLRLYRGGPLEPRFLQERRFEPGEAFVPDGSMAGDDAVRFTLPGQWCSFKAYFASGSYRLEVLAEGPSAGGSSVEVISFANRPIAHAELVDGTARIILPSDDKYWLRLHLPQGTVLRGVMLTSTSERAASSAE